MTQSVQVTLHEGEISSGFQLCLDAVLMYVGQPTILYINLFLDLNRVSPVFVGPCHHGMARPQVADGGTASDMEGSCEYIE